MRILYIANRIDVAGGGQVSLIELVRSLDRSRFEPVVLCPGEGDLSRALSETGTEVLFREMPSLKTWRAGRIFSAVGKLRRTIRRVDADIVHTNGSRAQLYAFFASGGLRAKLVWHVRVSFREPFLYDSFLFGGADRVICASRGVVSAKFPFSAGGPDKLRVIYNGVDTDLYGPDMGLRERSRREFGFPDGRPLLGSAGMIVDNKRFDVLIDAFARIRNECGDMCLLIAGEERDPELSARLRKMTSRYGITDRVFFLGGYKDMPGFLSSLDLFVLPSAREGFSRVLLEAMSCGLPVITTDVPGNNEAVEDGVTGTLVPPDDPRRLALAIKEMAGDKEMMSRTGEAAREHVKKSFSIQKHTREVQELYDELLTERQIKK
jgi:glycosyltransferase involved in cell wall biosynthesis